MKLTKLIIFLIIIFPIYSEESFIPDPPPLNSSTYMLLDSVTGRVIAENNIDERIEPASLTKIMTDYVVADQIDKGFVSIDDEVLISENCWGKEESRKGSRMFIKEGQRVLLSDLIKGMIIQSGNDASCSIAEHVAASEQGFVQLMQRYAQQLGLENTNFRNVTGWPEEGHYSTAKDLSILTRRLINDFPSHYALYKEKSFEFNGIRQPNRNGLLWQDETIDGVKTGHTQSAGYCLISSGIKNNTRLISITLKGTSEKSRLRDNRKLLDYGFRYFRTKEVLSSKSPISIEEVWGGEKEAVELFPAKDIFLTLSSRDFKRIQSSIILNDYLLAPLQEGQVVGKVELSIDEKFLAEVALVPGQDIEALGFMGTIWANLKLIAYKFLKDD
tara:strand:+ start:16862 stop:18022 length:1161 start_codon:yes stop_codon:yes gene_type:complete